MGRENPWLSVCADFIVFEMRMCEFFLKNIAEWVVILLNCSKGRKLT